LVEEKVKEEVEDNVVSNVENKVILQDFAKMQRKKMEMATSLNDQMEIERALGNKAEMDGEIETILKVLPKSKETEKEALQVLRQRRSVTKKENAQILDQSASTKKETIQIAREKSLQVAAEINVRAENTKEVEVQN